MIQKDIIYGNIELNGIFEKIVNCKDFMRLKDIIQTSMSTLEWKNLKQETRYEHSIGVYYLICITLNNIEKKLSAYGIKISQKEKDMAKLAALLHDIGHGAGSHLLEKITGLSHEKRGIDIIRDKNTDIHKIIVSYYGEEFIEELVEFMECIYGNNEISETIKILPDNTVHLKELLAALISNNIDLDRLDYLSRESTITGLGTLANYRNIIDSFEYILAGNQIVLAVPEDKMYLLEATILERMRNYQKIYYSNIDFIGNEAFKNLLLELREHPEEVPNTVPSSIKKFLTSEKADFTNQEYMELLDSALEDAIKQISEYAKSEKVKYLCGYLQNAEKDYHILYNSDSEEYVRRILKMAIPEFPENSRSIFSSTNIITPYKKTKFGSTNIITSQGIKKFEELPHAISLKPITRSVIAINPELLRLEMGMSKEEFNSTYADTIKEIIQDQTKPRQEFELKYVLTKNGIYYQDIMEKLQAKYEIKDSAEYFSKDVYYDIPDNFSLLSNKQILRIRDGATHYNGEATRKYKNKRITYKTYVEDNTTYTDREKAEQIGNSTCLSDYQGFLNQIGLSNVHLQPTLEVIGLRQLYTILVNGKPIDISFIVGTYQNTIFEMPGHVRIIEIRPRENQILGRLGLLEIKQALEDEFPDLKDMVSTANIYEIGIAESYEKYKKGYIISDDGKEFEKTHPEAIACLNEAVENIKKRNGVTYIAEIPDINSITGYPHDEI